MCAACLWPRPPSGVCQHAPSQLTSAACSPHPARTHRRAQSQRLPVRGTPASACFLDVPEVQSQSPQDPDADASSVSRARYKALYGGPPASGLGAAGPQLDYQYQEILDAQPEPGDPQRTLLKALRRIARSADAPIDHLPIEQQIIVQEYRLQLVLGKYWGLMHEADRPWHRHVVIRLCLLLPEPARSRYRQMKPSTMQHLLAKRAQAEKGVRDLHDMACAMQRRATQLLRKQAAQGVRADRYIVSWAELRQQSKKLQIDLGYVRSKVLQLQRQAQQGFHDPDYTAYVSSCLLPILDQLVAWRHDFGTGLRAIFTRGQDDPPATPPTIPPATNSVLKGRQRPQAAGSGISSGVTGSVSGGATRVSGQGSTWLGTLPVPAYVSAQWRYPPQPWDTHISSDTSNTLAHNKYAPIATGNPELTLAQQSPEIGNVSTGVDYGHLEALVRELLGGGGVTAGARDSDGWLSDGVYVSGDESEDSDLTGIEFMEIDVDMDRDSDYGAEAEW